MSQEAYIRRIEQAAREAERKEHLQRKQDAAYGLTWQQFGGYNRERQGRHGGRIEPRRGAE